MATFLGLLLVVVLIGMNGFFVAVEFALIAADKSKLKAEAEAGKLRARAALSARNRLSFHLSGAQLGITITSLLVGLLAESMFGRILSPITDNVSFLSGRTASIILALSVATVFQMVAGELVPKALAVSRPEAASQILAPIAIVVHGLLKPMILLFNGIANWTVRRLGMEPQEDISESTSLEELDYIIRSSGDSGLIAPDELALLTRTIRFGEKTAADALVPRTQVKAIEVGTDLATLVSMVGELSHSRYPVFDGDLDGVVGVIDIVNVLNVESAARDATVVESLMVEPLVVPETRELLDIVNDFRSHSSPMAIVVDEHGGTAGILTVEDVLEEIVGDVEDEFDESSVLTVGVGEGVFLLQGSLHPDEVEEACGFVMPEGPYETLAGFILSELGHLPYRGESVHYQGWRLDALELDHLRIVVVRIVAPPMQDPDSSEDGSLLGVGESK